MVFKRLGSLLTGRPHVSPEAREMGLAYYRQSISISALQTREADRYNSALVIHLNSIDRGESVRALVEASRRLALCAKECIRRHSLLSSVPELAGRDYATWSLLYQDYSNWAEASHDAFVALSQGLTPAGQRVQQLMDISERRRKAAEAEGAKLLRSLGLKASDLPRFAAAGQEAMDKVDWEPPD